VINSNTDSEDDVVAAQADGHPSRRSAPHSWLRHGVTTAYVRASAASSSSVEVVTTR
jgi:hypothetical protein